MNIRHQSDKNRVKFFASIIIFVTIVAATVGIIMHTQQLRREDFHHELSQIDSSLDLIIWNCHRYFDDPSTEHLPNINNELLNIYNATSKIQSRFGGLPVELPGKLLHYVDKLNGLSLTAEPEKQKLHIEHICRAAESFYTIFEDSNEITITSFTKSATHFIETLCSFAHE